jgi:hypothetical protein
MFFGELAISGQQSDYVTENSDLRPNVIPQHVLNFKRFKEETIQGMAKGKKLGDAVGVFGQMIKHLLECMLEGELTHHLEESKAS